MTTDERTSRGEPLAVEVGPLPLRLPLVGASGTGGFGAELNEFGVLPSLGALVLKTITLEPRRGNPPPRTCETAAGLINSIGLANPGIEAFLRDIVPGLAGLPCPCIANVGGESAEEYVELARRLAGREELVALELNLSCPNVTGGMDLSRSPDGLGTVTRAVRQVWPRPLWVKVTPTVADIRPGVAAAAEAGADAVVVANTHLAMSVDWRKRRSRIGRLAGGLSGPAIKPLALRLVYEAVSVGVLPVVASGGIMTAEDVLEFVTAGAAAVELGTALLRDPTSPHRIVADLRRLLREEGIPRISDLTGALGR